MKKQHYDEFAEYMTSEVKKMRDAGQKEYAEEENVFADFESTAKLSGITPEIVIYTFLNKHIRGIGSYLKGHEKQRDTLDGRIKDAIVYLQLLWAYVDEKEWQGINESN
tara:strand:- start:692 stop:1018 length:327 start_codon:yes stop_codon:yes gene_type:complete